MKCLWILLAVFSISLSSCDPDDPQNSNVPSVVLNKFKIEFPEAAAIDWEKNNEEYVVEFEVGKIDHKIVLDSRGNILKLKKEIAFSELPRAVTETISNSYRSTNKDGSEIILMNGTSYYQVELERFGIDDKIVFDENGKRMSNTPFWD